MTLKVASSGILSSRNFLISLFPSLTEYVSSLDSLEIFSVYFDIKISSDIISKIKNLAWGNNSKVYFLSALIHFSTCSMTSLSCSSNSKFSNSGF